MIFRLNFTDSASRMPAQKSKIVEVCNSFLRTPNLCGMYAVSKELYFKVAYKSKRRILESMHTLPSFEWSYNTIMMMLLIFLLWSWSYQRTDGNMQPETELSVHVIFEPKTRMQSDDLGSTHKNDVHNNVHTILLCWRIHLISIFPNNTDSHILQEKHNLIYLKNPKLSAT